MSPSYHCDGTGNKNGLASHPLIESQDEMWRKEIKNRALTVQINHRGDSRDKHNDSNDTCCQKGNGRAG